MKFIRQLAFVASFFLVGCQALIYGTASDFEKVSLGMTKAQVLEVLGSPAASHADGDKGEEYLIYKRMKHAISDWPRTYQVTLRGGKVVKYGEQYDEKNLNRY
jgi:outer membrane protein assembly factor BamE (lipoprotein component of BamABCDE complex)